MNGRLVWMTAWSLGVVLSIATAERAVPGTPSTSRALLPDSILENPRACWRLSSVQPEIQRRIHLVANKVPRFPHEDPRLMDPVKWPEAMRIGGETLPRRIDFLDYDYHREARSMKDVPPGSYYTLRYGEGRGPVYSWSVNGALAERSWRGGGKLPPDTYLYMYHPSGELMRFEHFSHAPGQQADPRRPAHTLKEVFARNGTLIGCGYVTQYHGDREAFTGYWLGEVVTYREFLDRTLQFQRSAWRSLSKTKRP